MHGNRFALFTTSWDDGHPHDRCTADLLICVYVGLLKAIERVSARFVDHVIVSNYLWLKTVAARSVPEERCSILINHVDPEMFPRHARTRTDEKFIVLFPGSLHWHQGLDIAIEPFTHVKRKVPNASRFVQRLNLEESVKFSRCAAA
jgi:glycosyltransferase involved in cell wall biosynthesis